MLSTDVLLSVPTESVAVRAIVASVAALLLTRLLLRAGLRVPHVRVAAVLVPTTALVLVGVLSTGRTDLPVVMRPVDAVNGLAVPVGDGYVHFAPLAWPILVGLWAAVAATRIGIRIYRVRRVRSRAEAQFRVAATAEETVRDIVLDLADRLAVDPPPIALAERCQGGAAVIGIRRPVLVIDRGLAERLDEQELEGLVAHELSHIRRRDNLVAVAVGVARDLAFFVPGGRWVLRHLHAEREVAADAMAVDVTARPGALASGLLKVVETQRRPEACAAFAPGASIESRVELLIGDDTMPTRARRVVEPVIVALAILVATVVALEVPSRIACDDCQREALAVLWTPSQGADESAAAEATPATAFDVYQRHRLAPGDVRRGTAVVTHDDARDLNPHVLRGTADLVGYNPDASSSLGLVPSPTVRIDEDLVDRWRAKAVVDGGDGLGLYWLGRIEP